MVDLLLFAFKGRSRCLPRSGRSPQSNLDNRGARFSTRTRGFPPPRAGSARPEEIARYSWKAAHYCFAWKAAVLEEMLHGRGGRSERPGAGYGIGATVISDQPALDCGRLVSPSRTTSMADLDLRGALSSPIASLATRTCSATFPVRSASIPMFLAASPRPFVVARLVPRRLGNWMPEIPCSSSE